VTGIDRQTVRVQRDSTICVSGERGYSSIPQQVRVRQFEP